MTKKMLRMTNEGSESQNIQKHNFLSAISAAIKKIL